MPAHEINLWAYIDPTGGLPPSIWGVLLASLLGGLGVAMALLKLWGRHLWRLLNTHRGMVVLLVLLAGGIVGGVAFFRKAQNPAAPPAAAAKQRVVILALDGLDPGLCDQFLAEGKLPNLARLAGEGVYRRLATVTPPQSPVAWSSFITSRDAASHGVFDFIKRDPRTYLPDISIADRRNGKLPWRGEPFWDHGSISEQGLVALRLPLTFPAPKLNGRLLAGMGVWDVRGTEGTYAFFSTSPVKLEEPRGIILNLVANGTTLRGDLPGPYVTGQKSVATQSFEIDLGSKPQPTLKIQGKTYPLRQDGWSDWISVEFRFGALNLEKIRGITRAILHHSAQQTTLYFSPINLDPVEPRYVISYPKGYSAELDRHIGHYHTRGMPFDFQALKDGVISDDELLDQCRSVTDETERMLFHELAQVNRGMLFAYFEAPDIIQHMFWRTIDPQHALYNDAETAAHRDVISEHYRQLDALVGRVRAAMGDRGTLLVISDHGFAPFRRGVHLNAVLRRLGYLTLKPGVESSEDFLKGVDWSRTRAYALGINAVYLNLAGREGEGIVKPTDAAALLAQIKADLEAFIDPVTGDKAIKNVTIFAEGREISASAPDLVVGYARGYRASWSTAWGGVPVETTQTNVSKWSGDHCIAADEVPGVFFSSDPSLTAQNLMGVAPAVEAFLSGTP
ncbi:MAG: alkaline phosphatase family protein [Phycisphaeraceae bacterium]|nr:alkaline phosphatase family protein [Phycisphaeraceae bacterium]